MRRASAGLRVLGDLLITAGVIVALFAVYELFYTGVYTAAAQSALRQDLTRDWRTPSPSPATAPATRTPVPKLGDGVAILRIPRLGAGYSEVVVEGVAVADLRKGPGHYPGTAMPGRVGNFVVSGHRTTYGAPFGQLDRLRPSDPIVLETRAGWYVYRVTRQQIVAPTAIDVIDPVPEHPGARPTQAMLTFTTCHPRYSARERLVVFGRLDSVRLRAAGPPPVLAG